MTISSSERAQSVIRQYLDQCDNLLGPDGKTPLLEYLVEQAIREACNEKLEEAAQVCERRALANNDGVAPNGTCLNDAFAIRSIKDTTQ